MDDLSLSFTSKTKFIVILHKVVYIYFKVCNNCYDYIVIILTFSLYEKQLSIGNKFLLKYVLHTCNINAYNTQKR